MILSLCCVKHTSHFDVQHFLQTKRQEVVIVERQLRTTRESVVEEIDQQIVYDS